MVTRVARISQFVTDRSPEAGSKVELLCEDHNGTYLLPFACLRTKDGWVNADTMRAVEVDVLGWREDRKIRRKPAIQSGAG